MKAFGGRYYMLRDARLEVRLVYSAFLFFVAIGMITVAAFQLHHIGATPSAVASHYRGGERDGEMIFPKTSRELVETTHFHSFIMGVVYLVLAHLFIATSVSPRTQQLMIVLAFAGLAGDIIVPWLIRYASGVFSYLLLGSWAAEWIGFGAFVAIPMREMWWTSDDADD